MTHLQSTNKSVDYPTQMIGRNQIVKHYRKQCALTSPLTLNETHKNALAHHEGIFPLLNRSTQTFVTACPSGALVLTTSRHLDSIEESAWNKEGYERAFGNSGVNRGQLARSRA